MNISVNWLKNYINLPTSSKDILELSELFTVRTAEVEDLVDLAATFKKIVIGKIEAIEPHPDADRLKITKTNVGTETLQIVCGATNIEVGQLIPVALIGASVRWHGEGEPIGLTPAKIRGIESFGMICAAEEIGLKSSVDGILDLTYTKAQPGTPLAEVLNKNDFIIKIDNKSLTHRPDLWGHYGIARELAAILDEKLRPLPTFTDYPKVKNIIVDAEIQEPELCPRYECLTINNITVEPSPQWLKNALENIGHRSINNIVDATNFVMHELGQPLHAFDTSKIKDGIIVRKAKNNEEITTLDGVKRKLTKTMLVIADHEKAIAIAGIMGGKNSEITTATQSVTIESANFDPVCVRKTSKILGLRTDAVQRYEKSLDPHLTDIALNRIVQIILEICPQASLESQKVDRNNFNYQPTFINFNTAKANSKIGIQISDEEITELLEKLEFKVQKSSQKNLLKVEVPSFRATKDINHQDDLVEEVARLYGYEKLPKILPELSVTLPIPNEERLKKILVRKTFSTELGFHEIIDYSFYSSKDIENANLNEGEHLKLKNYLSEEQTHLRTSLVPGILKNIAHNLKLQDSFKIYEIGRTYKYIQQFFPLEEEKVAGAIILNKKDKTEPFYLMKGAIESLLDNFNLQHLKFKKAEKIPTFAHPVKVAAYADPRTQQEIIHIFELHPKVAKNYGLEGSKIVMFELNYTQFLQVPRSEKVFKPFPKFPGIEIDVSFLIDKKTEIGTAQKAIQKANQSLIEKVKLLDIYQGANLSNEKKSLTFKISLQAPDRTLTEEDMRVTQEKVFKEIEKIGGEIRKA